MSNVQRPDDASLRMAAKIAAAWSTWVLDQPSPGPPVPEPVPAPSPSSGGFAGFESVVGQVVRSLALVAASINHSGQGVDGVQLIAFAKPLVVWAESVTATTAVLSIKGDPMPLTVDSTNSLAVLSFTDDHGDAVSAPSGALVTATSDNTAVLTVGAAEVGADANGNAVINFPLTEVSEGTANLSVTATDANGNPLLGPDGATPIATPAPVAVTVNPGAAADEVFTVPGD